MTEEGKKHLLAGSLPQLTRNWWPVVLAGVFVLTSMSGGIGYYARTEAEKIIEVKMKRTFKQLQDFSKENRRSFNEFKSYQREMGGRYDERLKAIDKNLNTIIDNQRRYNK